MIKVNELRPGNYVLHNDELMQIESYCNGKVNVYAGYYGDAPHIHGIDCGNINLIPLTPEWMERCGFKEGTNYLFGKQLKLGIHSDYTYIGTLTSTSAAYVAPTQYVHQLQNLYFALTGDELQIKDL